ncbi:MAG TPA: hypothetical protein VLJ62_07765 [Burkholderiaceae bacterium]|nr:hypothetical protein [Burkholderiaceae bacterium]
MNWFKNEGRKDRMPSSAAAVAAPDPTAAATAHVQDDARSMAEHRRAAALERAAARDDIEVEDAVITTEPRGEAQAPSRGDRHAPSMTDDEQLAPLFSPGVAQDFRARWDATQISFVDDPRQAVQQADELVAQMMNSLAQSFADERAQLESRMNETASTENLRVALQRYRSFFQRLLAL